MSEYRGDLSSVLSYSQGGSLNSITRNTVYAKWKDFLWQRKLEDGFWRVSSRFRNRSCVLEIVGSRSFLLQRSSLHTVCLFLLEVCLGKHTVSEGNFVLSKAFWLSVRNCKPDPKMKGLSLYLCNFPCLTLLPE